MRLVVAGFLNRYWVMRHVDFADTLSRISPVSPHLVRQRVFVREIEADVGGWIGSVILDVAHVRQSTVRLTVVCESILALSSRHRVFPRWGCEWGGLRRLSLGLCNVVLAGGRRDRRRPQLIGERECPFAERRATLRGTESLRGAKGDIGHGIPSRSEGRHWGRSVAEKADNCALPARYAGVSIELVVASVAT